MSPPLHPEPSFTRSRFALGVLILGICSVLASQSAAQTFEENQVKAAYLYNFAKFVEWPPGVFRGLQDPAVICVVGDKHMSGVLQQAVVGKRVNGRPVEARKPLLPAEFKLCHILFITFHDKARIEEMLTGLRKSSVLTVGQSDQFIPLGGMINLAEKNTRIDLEIDPEASNAVGLKISSRLLIVARQVTTRHVAGGER